MFENAAPQQEGPARPAAPRRWGVSKQPSTAELIQKLADNDPSITTVDISNNATFQIKAEEYTTLLANALKRNTHVKELRLENCGLGDREGVLLGEAMAENNSIVLLDLQKNKINNEGGSALAKGLTHNKSLVTLDLMNMAKTRWGDHCLDCFLGMFDHNVTLLKINWRLESRKSFALNKMLTRNNEIDRRKKSGMPINDILPTSLKAPTSGEEQLSPSLAPAPASSQVPTAVAPPSAEPLPPSVDHADGKENADPSAPDSAPLSGPPDAPLSRSPPAQQQQQQQPPSSSGSAHHAEGASEGVALRAAHFSGSFGGRPPSSSGSKVHAAVGALGASGPAHAPRADMPRVRRAGASVLARWPPAQYKEQET